MNARRTILFLLLTVFPATLSAQWTWLNPLPEGNSFHAVDFINENEGWVAGANGSVMRTRDGGGSWESLPSIWRHTPQIGLGIVFRDASVGLISANNGTLLRTTDGGLSWTPLPRSGLSIHTLRRAPDGAVWGVGSFGTVARSTDMGLHWERFSTGTTTVVYDIDFPTGSDVVAVCGGGLVLTSGDAGSSWTQHTPSLPTDIVSVDFTSATHGYALQQPRYLLRTTDGGQSWSDTSLTVNTLHAVRFVSPERGWIVSNSRGRVLRSTNAGASWEEMTVDPARRYTFFSIYPMDEYRALVVGQAGSVFRTANTGESWTQSGNAFTRAHFTSVTALGDSTAWWFGIGAAWRTTDAGSSWSGSDTLGSTGLRFGYALSPTRLIGGGSQGQMLLSTDAGGSWSTQTLSAKGQINHIVFVDDNTGWVAGAHGTLGRTVDGGESWTELDAGVTHDLNGLAALDADNAWVVGNGGRIFRSTDAGGTWAEVQSPVSNDLHSVHFFTPTHGLIGGQRVLLETTDGGSSWVQLPLPSGFDNIRRMVFSDALHGAFMLDQAVVRTRDGGKTFYRYDYPSSALTDLQMTGTGYLWLAGDFGTAMRYTPAAAIVLRPQALDFGDVPVNKSRELSFTLENAGEADLVISNVATIGDGFLFAGGSLDPLPPTGVRSLFLAFAPQDTGMAYGVASLYSNSVQGVPHIDLAGHGLPAGTTALVHSPDTVDFGVVRLGSSARSTVVITNRVDQHLLINREVMRGGDSLVFKVTRESAFFLPSGVTDSIEMQFTPLEPGQFRSWCIVESNDPVEPEYAIPVVGAAVTPKLATDSMTVHFDFVYIGATAERTLSLRNEGDALLNVSSIILRGRDAAEFSFTGAGSSIVPGGNMLLTLRCSPTSYGPKEAQLVVFSDDLRSPEFVVELRANATTTGTDRPQSPARLSLEQNYPNPHAAGSAPLRYDFRIARPAEVRFTLYDASGRRVGGFDGRPYAAGMHRVSVDDAALPPGLYIAEIHAAYREGAAEVLRVKTLITK